MQKEHVHDVSRPHDSGDDAEQATDEARDGEWDEVIWARHVRRPDLARKGADETPEDDRTAADEAGKRREQERTSHPPSERGGDGVEQVGLRLSVCGDLEDEGELVGVGRHLAREAGEADACENDDLLPYRPVLYPGLIYIFSILHAHRRLEVRELGLSVSLTSGSSSSSLGCGMRTTFLLLFFCMVSGEA